MIACPLYKQSSKKKCLRTLTSGCISYRQARNLKQILVRSSLKELPFDDNSDQTPPGCFRHQHGARGRQCMLCSMLKEGDGFQSKYTGLNYRIRHTLTCKSKYCVYLIICRGCGIQYVGKSINYMHVRHTRYRQEIDNQSSELSSHFSWCWYNNLTLQIINRLCEGWWRLGSNPVGRGVAK